MFKVIKLYLTLLSQTLVNKNADPKGWACSIQLHKDDDSRVVRRVRQPFEIKSWSNANFPATPADAANIPENMEWNTTLKLAIPFYTAHFQPSMFITVFIFLGMFLILFTMNREGYGVETAASANSFITKPSDSTSNRDCLGQNFT